MSLIITGTYASCLALLFLLLSIAVIKQRRSNLVSLGDGQIGDLQKAIRAHGNFAEYVPICLLLLAVAEINSGAGAYLHIPGSLLLIGRLLHAYGLVKKSGASKPRVYGMMCTFIVLIGLSAWNLFTILMR